MEFMKSVKVWLKVMLEVVPAWKGLTTVAISESSVKSSTRK